MVQKCLFMSVDIYIYIFLVPKCSMAIKHGKLSDLCSGYVNSTCDYECYSGYLKTLTGKLTCNDHLNWVQQTSVDVNMLCK